MPRLLLLLLPMVLAAPAHAQVFKCVDDEGRVTYTHDRNMGRGCTMLPQDLPVSSVPSPQRSAPAPAATPGDFPRVTPDAQRTRDNTRREILEAELAKEEQALQEARKALADEEERDAPEDRNARARIAQADGSVKLGPATINQAKRNERIKPFQDKVELHQRNIEALQREMRSLR
jgi:hypothetical protein